MWSDAGMSSADRGLIEGALYAASMLEGGFQQNFSTVLAKVRAAKDDDVRFQAQMNNFLGEETLDEFINRVTMEDGFFYDKPNANAAFEMRGFVEYQIASGKGKETVESDLKRYFEQQYHPLQGVVIDPAFQQADRSRQALGGRFGKRVPEVVSIMNTMVADLGIDTARFRLDLLTQGTETRRRIRGVAGAEEEVIEGEVTPRPEGIDTELRLMPLPFAGTTAEDVQYITMTINDTGDVVPFVYNDEEGRPQFLYFGLDDLSQRLLEKTN